ncbi:MAG: hypothetical protein NZZ41_06650 [Candidatus Dojkabacteria bacterium]|nr:hypothetical protein [Candidatus Dojkabacteria bacterium]
MRTDDISNIIYTANNINEVGKVFDLELDTLLEKIENFPGMYVSSPGDLLTFVIRFWEYRPPFLIAKGFIKTPKWLENRKIIINIQNTDNQCFIKCLYRALNYDEKNRNNNRDVNEEELKEFKKTINCLAIEDGVINIEKFEDDNPDLSIDIYKIPLTEEKAKKVKLIY